jgi:hypothetical protein
MLYVVFQWVRERTAGRAVASEATLARTDGALRSFGQTLRDTN